MLTEVEEMKAKQNSVSKEIPKLKKEVKDAKSLLTEMRQLSDKIKEMDMEVKEIDGKLKNKLLHIPNTPHETVAEGVSDDDNVEIRKWESLLNSILNQRPIGI